MRVVAHKLLLKLNYAGLSGISKLSRILPHRVMRVIWLWLRRTSYTIGCKGYPITLNFFQTARNIKPNRVVSDRRSLYNNARPASIRWDAAAMMAVPKEGVDKNWWRPPSKPAPVKHFTKEELEIEYPAFTVSKKRKDAT